MDPEIRPISAPAYDAPEERPLDPGAIVASIRRTHGEPGLSALADALRVEEARASRDRVLAGCTTALDAVRQARQVTEPHIGRAEGFARQRLQIVAARLREADLDLEREIARIQRTEGV